MDYLDALPDAIAIGAGATAFMDVALLARRRLFGVPFPDYGLVGRWIGWMPRGRFRHPAIKAAPPLPGELAIGWTAHYLIGMSFAAVLPAIGEPDWVARPTLAPALIVGIASVAAPLLLMQPGMGLGLAASRAPRPGAARIQALATHAVFGLGLYAAGWAASWLRNF